MSQTVRQMMIEILRNGPVSAKDISALVGVPEKDIFSASRTYPEKSASWPPSLADGTSSLQLVRLCVS